MIWYVLLFFAASIGCAIAVGRFFHYCSLAHEEQQAREMWDELCEREADEVERRIQEMLK